MKKRKGLSAKELKKIADTLSPSEAKQLAIRLARVAGQPAPDLSQGIRLTIDGGAVEVTNGSDISKLNAAETQDFLPHPVRRGQKDRRYATDPAVCTVCLSIQARSKSRVFIDASGMARHAARWGSPQLLFCGPSSDRHFEPLEHRKTAFDLQRGETLTVVGVGFGKNIDVRSVFGSFFDGERQPRA